MSCEEAREDSQHQLSQEEEGLSQLKNVATLQNALEQVRICVWLAHGKTRSRE